MALRSRTWWRIARGMFANLISQEIADGTEGIGVSAPNSHRPAARNDVVGIRQFALQGAQLLDAGWRLSMRQERLLEVAPFERIGDVPEVCPDLDDGRVVS